MFRKSILSVSSSLDFGVSTSLKGSNKSMNPCLGPNFRVEEGDVLPYFYPVEIFQRHSSSTQKFIKRYQEPSHLQSIGIIIDLGTVIELTPVYLPVTTTDGSCHDP